MNKPRLTAAALAALLLCGCAPFRPFQPDIRSERNPWTHERFKNDPDAFQFVIMSDRTGGRRPGIFGDAVRKVNLLQPEFVICVGDLFDGYTLYPDKLDKDWADFGAIVGQLEMPFFHVEGNHDVSNFLTDYQWCRMLGRRYYHFLYRNVLFMCLDTQEGEHYHGGVSAKQIAWAKGVLAEHPDVRWTLLFMHQPLWLDEERAAGRPRRRHEEVETGPRFAEIQAALKGRNHTLFAGHHHQYSKYVRDKHNYHVLASTGGFTNEAGPDFGWLDHVLWVTMTPSGPRFAGLNLDGIHDETLYSEEIRQRTGQTLAPFAALTIEQPRGEWFLPNRIETTLANNWDSALTGTIIWQEQTNSPWTASPITNEVLIPAGGTQAFAWDFTCSGDLLDPDSLWPTPYALVNLRNEERVLVVDRAVRLRMDEWPYGGARGQFWRELGYDSIRIEALPCATNITVWPFNPIDERMEGVLTWQLPDGSAWDVEPPCAMFGLATQEEARISFSVTYSGPLEALLPVPAMLAEFTAQDGLSFSNTIPLAVEPEHLLVRHIRTLACRTATGPVQVDGKLDDAAWQRAPDVDGFAHTRLHLTPSLPTRVWTAYDAQNLYVAFRCVETNLAELAVGSKERDNGYWSDDYVEFYLDTRYDTESYYVFGTTAAGIPSDSRHFYKTWDGEFTHAVGREEQAWTAEFAIPWETIASWPPPEGFRMGVSFFRNRRQSWEHTVWPPLAYRNLRAELCAVLRFE
ncbi:MAG: metallophosphoesterase [Kiritimatiellae bacterium]|nr:metallophosphoesterase [Kiritimatiellia bacterium]